MEEKKMRELNLDEMDKVSGGAGNATECTQHNWVYQSFEKYLCAEEWRCSICGAIKFIYNDYEKRSPIPIPDPDPKPISLE